MVSDNVKRAERIISTYPEVFESLLEFERTRKLPKLYRRKRINLTIDENLLRRFKEYCHTRALNMSQLVEKKMLEEMKKT